MYEIQMAKESIKDGIEIYLQKDKNNEYVMKEVNRLPFYLEGRPGIGKTEIVEQIANELGIGFVSFSLTHHTRNSLLGLPVIKDLQGGKYTEYTMSEIIAKVLAAKEAGQEEGILLLDEFSCVSDSILPAMLAFLQTKNIGMHHLPEGWVIVLCGNPPEYNKSAKRFDAAILDRIRKVSVMFSPEVFIRYAKEKGFHPTICSYLKINPKNVYRCDNKNSVLVTCRGWENLSHTLYGAEKLKKDLDMDLVMQFIKSEEIAYSFIQYWNLNRVGMEEKDIEAILSGTDPQKYYEKYADKDFDIWWNAIDVIGDYIKVKHDQGGETTKQIELGKALIKQLRKSRDIKAQIGGRLTGYGWVEEYIPRWNRGSSKYVPLEDIEKDLLESWAECLEEVEMHMSDQEVLDYIQMHIKDMESDYHKQVKEVSKEISNVIAFIRMKENTLLEKFYQRINHDSWLLGVVVETKNPDYVELCKKNFAVG